MSKTKKLEKNNQNRHKSLELKIQAPFELREVETTSCGWLLHLKDT